MVEFKDSDNLDKVFNLFNVRETLNNIYDCDYNKRTVTYFMNGVNQSVPPIKTIGDLRKANLKEFSKLPSVGYKVVNFVRHFLAFD